MPFEIFPLSKKYVAEVARLHLRYLHTPFKGEAGELFLRLYYETICQEEGGIGFVVMTNKQVAGFICGIWNPSLVRKNLITRQWKSLILSSIRSLFSTPALIGELFHRLTDLTKRVESSPLQGYELRPIVIAENFRGSEAGSLLVSALLKDAKERGRASIFLITEQDNMAANRFYKKQGFEQEATFRKTNQDYIIYTHTL